MDPSQLGPNEPALACNARPFSPEQRRRWEELGASWRAEVAEIRELPDGYALRIPSDATTVLAAAEWMTLDRLCCPFFRFALEIEPEGGPAWVRLTGGGGVKEFLRRAIEGEDPSP